MQNWAHLFSWLCGQEIKIWNFHSLGKQHLLFLHTKIHIRYSVCVFAQIEWMNLIESATWNFNMVDSVRNSYVVLFFFFFFFFCCCWCCCLFFTQTLTLRRAHVRTHSLTSSQCIWERQIKRGKERQSEKRCRLENQLFGILNETQDIFGTAIVTETTLGVAGDKERREFFCRLSLSRLPIPFANRNEATLVECMCVLARPQTHILELVLRMRSMTPKKNSS